MANKVKVKVMRGTDNKRYFKSYNVTHDGKLMVLGALRQIQENSDGTLAFRWNCGEGICGSCAVEVDGKPILACKTQIPVEIKEITITPLKAFPVIKDLVFDRIQVDNQLKRIKPYFITNSKVKGFWKMDEQDTSDSAEFRTCINCLICHDSCHVLRDTKLDFLGPRNLVKTAALDKHPMNSVDRSPLLKKEGLQNCNVTRCCTDNCPQNIKITQNAIIPFKEKSVSNEIVPLWKLWGKSK